MTELAPAPRPSREAPGLEPWPRRDPISRLPIVLLALNARCNCRCRMCDIWQARGKKEITAAEVARLLPEWRQLRIERVVLTGGEPLLAREVWEIAAVLAEAGIGITLLTTGLLLERDADSVVRFVDDLVVSLDGPPAVHDRIRNIPRAFERLAAGVAAVRRLAPALSVSGRTTVQRDNFRHLRETVDAARKMGLTRLSFLAADVSSEAFHRPGGWPAERAAQVALGRDDLPDLAAELAALERDHAADFASGFLAEPPAKLHRRLYQYFAALAGVGELPPVACNAPWVSAVVEAGGTVRPCFFHEAYGKLNGGGFTALLNEPAAVIHRQALDPTSNEICRRCVCSLELKEHPEGVPDSQVEPSARLAPLRGAESGGLNPGVSATLRPPATLWHRSAVRLRRGRPATGEVAPR